MARWYVTRSPQGEIISAHRRPTGEATEPVDDDAVELVEFLKPAAVKAMAVAAEAERRLTLGIMVNGRPFRCDDAAAQRMRELADGLASMSGSPSSTQSFCTAAGAILTVDANGAKTIADAQRAYRGAVLGRSAALQQSLPDNPTDELHWPAVPEILV